jgi:aspartate/methionine/tyrosine aminotransferase
VNGIYVVLTNVNIFMFNSALFDEVTHMVRRSLVAKRLTRIRPSSMRKIFSVTQREPNVINLGIGEPDFVPPAHVINAAKQALDKGKTHYPPSHGIPQLCEALAGKAKHDYGLEYDPTSEILVTVGASEAVFLALMALVNPRDEVLLFDPGFVCYAPDVLLAEGVPVSVPMRNEDGFKLDVDAVMSRITDKSRVIIINSPNNPTGAVFSHDDLLELSKLVVERDLTVISDEVYEKIVYDEAEHFCLATFPGMRERTIVVGSFSKTYAMTGFRVGYALGPAELIDPMLKVHQCSVACVDGLAQFGAVAALEGSQGCVKTMVREFDRRRRLMHKRINEIEGFSCSLPKGAFYVFANIRQFNMSSTGFADYLCNEGEVATIPGCAFGENGEGYIRLSYSIAYEKIEEAMGRVEKVVKKLC